MGVISHQQIKYFLNIVWCVFIIVYLLINVLDIINCLQGLKLAAAVAVVIEVGCCYLISGSAIEEKTSWKASSVVVVLCELLGCLLGLHGLIVLFGAPLLKSVEETFSLSLLLTALCCVRPFIALGPQAATICFSNRRVAGVLESESRAVLCLLGAWLGALPIPLDWDRPWQAWPLTCAIGALLGDICASCYLLHFSPMRQHRMS